MLLAKDGSVVAVDLLDVKAAAIKKANEDLNKSTDALLDVVTEQISQRAIWGKQEHSPLKWLPILTEEVGEVAKEVCEITFDGKSTEAYRKELVQVAAVAVSMIDCLDEQEGRTT